MLKIEWAIGNFIKNCFTKVRLVEIYKFSYKNKQPIYTEIIKLNIKLVWNEKQNIIHLNQHFIWKKKTKTKICVWYVELIKNNI